MSSSAIATIRSAVTGGFLSGCGPEAATDPAHRRLYPLVIRRGRMPGELA
jgi:hypothetical protein